MDAQQLAWAKDWSLARLQTRFGALTTARGVDYANSGHVQGVTVGGAGTLVLATVRGSRNVPYQTVINRQTESLKTRCSCPMQGECKHVVALLVHLREGLAPPVPRWRAVLEPTRRVFPDDVDGTPLALEFSGRSADLSLRPLVWGRSGRWVRTGATWDGLEYAGSGHRHSHRRALRAIKDAMRRDGHSFYYGRSSDLQLKELTADVWPALSQAEEAGVGFVHADGLPVRLLREPARPIVHLDAAATGLTITGFAIIEGEQVRVGRNQVVGNPPHGIVRAGEDLVLGPFVRPLNEAESATVVHSPKLSIPAAEILEFATGYLPALRRQLELVIDPTIELPEVSAPWLAVRVTFGADALTDLSWTFRYRAAGEVTDVELLTGAQPFRNVEAERALVAAMPAGPWLYTDPALGRGLIAHNQLRGRESIAFVTESLPRLQAADDIEVMIEGDVPSYREAAEAPVIELRVTEPEGGPTDWFDLDVQVSIEGQVIEFRRMFTALAKGEDHLILPNGVWFSLDRPELDQLRDLIAEAAVLGDAEIGSLQLRPEHAGLWEELVELGVVAEQSAAWADAVSALLNLDELPAVGVPAGLAATLRPYQEVGFRWLAFLWRARLGGILADDMGLGKTLQALAVTLAAHEAGELDHPVLVVAPTSVVGTWAAEAAKFAPDLRVATITQTGRKRGTSLAAAIADAQLVVTSYALARLDETDYVEQPWAAVVLDEAQFVKNRQSKAYQAVRKLRARVKFAVTGTPLENNLMDLWSLLSITAPGLFADPEVFTEAYRRPIENGGDAEALGRLHRRVRPLMLRRTKEAVAAELPPKQEQVVRIALTPAHQRIYDRQLHAERRKVLALVDDLRHNRITILRSLTLLRQLSLSAGLVDRANSGVPSAKLDTLVEMLGEVAAEGHRALVFSQFTTFLTMARERLAREQIGTVYLDGRTRNRPERIAEFREGSAPVFLISLKAGGFGLTLTEADYVFILDPWWNPAAEAQAVDRTHRIGQDKRVHVYRLVSQNTIEEKVVALQERKKDLFAKVVGADGELSAPLTAADIRGLLAD